MGGRNWLFLSHVEMRRFFRGQTQSLAAWFLFHFLFPGFFARICFIAPTYASGDLTRALLRCIPTDMSVTLPVRDRLLTAATEVIASKGYSATRVSDIVQQAGVAQGTFYLYFKSKQAILEHLLDTFCSQLLDDTLGTYRLGEGSRLEDLIAQARQLWRTVLQRCRQERALMQLALREPGAAGPEVVARLQAHYQRVIDGFATYIEAAIAHGLCRPVDPRLAAWAIFGMLERAVHYAVLIEEQADLDQVADDLVRIELGGLLVDGWEEALASRGAQL